MRKSPRDTPCRYCGKVLTRKGCAEHERHACKKNPSRVKRSFKRVVCKHCGKSVHQTGLRVHVATQHPEAYARQPAVKAHWKREIKQTPQSSQRTVSPDPGKRASRSPQRAVSPDPAKPREQSAQPREQTAARIWREVKRRHKKEEVARRT